VIVLLQLIVLLWLIDHRWLGLIDSMWLGLIANRWLG
jgi:hypothetical protein